MTKILSTNVMSLICSYVGQYKKCVLYMSDLIRKDDRRPKKSCITQEIVNKMEEGRKWKNINNEERRRAELQKTKGRTEKCLREGQDEIFCQNMLRDQGSSGNRTL